MTRVRFTKKDRDIEGSPELEAQLQARISNIEEITNVNGVKEKVIRRA